MGGDNSQSGSIFSGIKLYDKNKYRMLEQGGASPHISLSLSRTKESKSQKSSQEALKEEKVKPELQLFKY